MQIKVIVDGYGEFQIENDKIGELINWLSKNEAIKVKSQPVREVVDNNFTGRTLITEQK